MFLMEGVMYMYMYINVMYIKRLIASEGWLQLTCDKEFVTSFLNTD